MIYFDNSATIGRYPNCVKRAVKRELNSPANAGRSGHKLAIKKLELVSATRAEVAKLFNCDFERVIFTKSCTESLNIAIFGSIKANAHIITTAFEHNSTLRPLYSLKNVEISVCEPEFGQITLNSIQKCVRANTQVVVLCLVSNVTGSTCELEKIAEFCKQKNIRLICDAAQAVTHFDIDIKKLGISMLAIAPHKSFFTPSGLGILLVDSQIQTLKPLIYGGNGLNSDSVIQGNEFPESFESGTGNYLAIAALNAGIKYFNENKKHMRSRLAMLSNYLYERLVSIDKIKIYSVKNTYGIVSFLIPGYDSSFIADYLDKNHDIATRSGLTCAPLTHKYLGTTQSGVVRVSLSHFNTKRQIDRLVESLKKILELN